MIAKANRSRFHLQMGDWNCRPGGEIWRRMQGPQAFGCDTPQQSGQSLAGYGLLPRESFRRRQDNLLSALHGNVPVKLSRITKETVTLSNAFIISAFTVKHFVQHLYNTGRKAPSESDDFCPKQTKKSLSFVA